MGAWAAAGWIAGAGALALAAWYGWERSHRRTRPMAGGLHRDVSLPHEQEWELYHNALSLCSKKVRVCLAELGIAYRSHPIDLIETGSYENIGRAFLAVNPAGIVPVLVHRGHPVYESHDIIRYAAEHAPRDAASAGSAHVWKTPLVPDDGALRERMQRMVETTSLVGDDPVAASHATAGNAIPGLTVPLFAAMIADIAWWRIAEGLLFHRLKKRPLLFMAMKASGLGNLHRGPAAKVVAKSARDMARHLDALDAELARSGGPWTLGDAFSLADVGWVPIFDRLEEADSLHCFLGAGRRPHATAYWERLRARPSYREAIAGHVHPAVVRGTQRLRAAKQASPALRAALEPV